MARGDPHHPLARRRDTVGSRSAPCVIDADDGGPIVLHAGDKPLLHRRISAHRAVPVEVVLAQIDENADRWIERGREVDLVGRGLDDVDTRRPRRLEREDGRPDVTADLGITTGTAEEMGHKGRGG